MPVSPWWTARNQWETLSRSTWVPMDRTHARTCPCLGRAPHAPTRPHAGPHAVGCGRATAAFAGLPQASVTSIFVSSSIERISFIGSSFGMILGSLESLRRHGSYCGLSVDRISRCQILISNLLEIENLFARYGFPTVGYVFYVEASLIKNCTHDI